MMTTDELSTGSSDDISEMTWPQVAAGVDSPAPEPADAMYGAFAQPRRDGFVGQYEFSRQGLAGKLEVRRQRAGGLDCVALELRLPTNHAGSRRPRTLWLSADVRASWIAEATRGASTRCDEGDRLIGAIAGLALLPGQRTVRVIEDGITLHDGLMALSGAVGVPA
jgi:hypothetical protein